MHKFAGLGKRRRILELGEPNLPSLSMLEETMSASESEGDEDSDEDFFGYDIQKMTKS